MSFRTRGHGRRAKRYPINPKTGGPSMFGEPGDKKLAEMVRGGSVEESRESARELEGKFKRSKSRAEKERIRKATQLEANRLEVGAHNSNDGPAARRSLQERAGIFDRAAERMDRQLKRSGS